MTRRAASSSAARDASIWAGSSVSFVASYRDVEVPSVVVPTDQEGTVVATRNLDEIVGAATNGMAGGANVTVTLAVHMHGHSASPSNAETTFQIVSLQRRAGAWTFIATTLVHNSTPNLQPPQYIIEGSQMNVTVDNVSQTITYKVGLFLTAVICVHP